MNDILKPANRVGRRHDVANRGMGVVLAVLLALVVPVAAQTYTVNGTIESFSQPNALGSYADLEVLNGGDLTFLPPAGSSFSGLFAGSGGKSVLVDASSLSYQNSAIIGGSLSGNSMQVVNGGFFTMTGSLAVGGANGDNGNSLVVSGSGSTFEALLQPYMYIGNAKSDGNQLSILNGAVARTLLSDPNGSTLVGNQGAGNSVVVSGTGSAWTNNGSVIVGDGTFNNNAAAAANNNSLTVDNGAKMQARRMAIGQFNVATNNSMLVSGPGTDVHLAVPASGTLHPADGSLAVGPNGIQSQLTVNNGASLRVDQQISVGGGPFGKDSSLQIDGAGTFVGTRYLMLGNYGVNNSVSLTDGATLKLDEALHIGIVSGLGNTLTMSGADTRMLVTNSALTGEVSVWNGLLKQDGGTLRADSLYAEGNGTTPAGIWQFNGGTSLVGQVTVNNGQVFQVGNGTSTALLHQNDTTTYSVFADGVQVGKNGTFRYEGIVETPFITTDSGTIRQDGGSVLLADQVSVTDGGSGTPGTWDIRGGTAIVDKIDVDNGQVLQVGDGVQQTLVRQNSAATINTFADGVEVNPNATFSVRGTVNTPQVLVDGGTLRGTGIINGDVFVQNGGVIAPGNSPGTLTLASATFGPGSGLQFDVNDFAGTAGMDPGWSFLNVVGNLNITATALNPFIISFNTLTLANVNGPAANWNGTFDQTWNLISAGSITGWTGDNVLLDFSSFENPYSGTFEFGLSGGGFSVNYIASPSAVPEPSTWALLVAGAMLVGLALLRRRRLALDAQKM